MSNPEIAPTPSSLERSVGAAAERQAEQLASRERSVEAAPEHTHEQAEHALEKAREQAISHEHPSHEKTAHALGTHHVRPAVNKKASYRTTLRHMQAELPPTARTFSKVIHQPIVESTSNFVGATIARPNALLFGALFAFILTGALYIIAKYLGYSLSGFESIGAFIIGWLFGVVVDFVRLAFISRH